MHTVSMQDALDWGWRGQNVEATSARSRNGGRAGGWSNAWPLVQPTPYPDRSIYLYWSHWGWGSWRLLCWNLSGLWFSPWVTRANISLNFFSLGIFHMVLHHFCGNEHPFQISINRFTMVAYSPACAFETSEVNYWEDQEQGAPRRAENQPPTSIICIVTATHWPMVHFFHSPPARWGLSDFMRALLFLLPFSSSSCQLNCQLQMPDASGHYRTSTAKKNDVIFQIECKKGCEKNYEELLERSRKNVRRYARIQHMAITCSSWVNHLHPAGLVSQRTGRFRCSMLRSFGVSGRKVGTWISSDINIR